MKRLLNHIDRLLIGAGIGLLIAGTHLAYPRVASRLAIQAPATSGPAVSAEPSIACTAAADATKAAPTRAATQRPTETFERHPVPSSMLASATAPAPTVETVEPEHRDRQGAPPTRIVIPTLRLDAPVVPVSPQETRVDGKTRAVWGVPDDYAAGWHKTSALLGESGNLVLNGHNTDHGEVFRNLYKLKTGDQVILYSDSISSTYRVSEALILPEAGQPLEVRLENARYVMPTDDRRLTLVTCHPYGSLRNRLVVIARPAGSRVASEPPEE